MFGISKKHKEENIQKLKEDIMITVPSVNKLTDSFHYYLIRELGKKDLEYIEQTGTAGRADNLLNNICELSVDALHQSLEEAGAWPTKKHWYDWLMRPI